VTWTRSAGHAFQVSKAGGVIGAYLLSFKQRQHYSASDWVFWAVLRGMQLYASNAVLTGAMRDVVAELI